MFTHIMVPYNLAEKHKWAKSIKVAGDLARHYGAKVTLVSIGHGAGGGLPKPAEDHARLLEAYAAQIAQVEGVTVQSQAYDVMDPSGEVDHKLIEAIDDIGADLVVMATHKPGWIEYLFSSHGGRMASRAPVSVFVVRDDA